MEITLAYTESSVTYSKVFEALALKGIDEPDRLRKNAIIHDYLNGNLEEQIDGFFKEPIEITFKPTLDEISMRFLTHWFIASAKWFIYGAYLSTGSTDESLISEWLYECEHNRAFTVKFWDEHKYYDFQDAGPIADNLVYAKRNILITGSSISPQTFTTGTAPLNNPMDNTENWPVFSDTTHVPIVVLSPNSSCQFIPCRVGNPTVVAGNVQFQAFISDMQAPASDGSYYVDVIVLLQAKP